MNPLFNCDGDDVETHGHHTGAAFLPPFRKNAGFRNPVYVPGHGDPGVTTNTGVLWGSSLDPMDLGDHHPQLQMKITQWDDKVLNSLIDSPLWHTVTYPPLRYSSVSMNLLTGQHVDGLGLQSPSRGLWSGQSGIANLLATDRLPDGPIGPDWPRQPQYFPMRPDTFLRQTIASLPFSACVSNQPQEECITSLFIPDMMALQLSSRSSNSALASSPTESMTKRPLEPCNLQSAVTVKQEVLPTTIMQPSHAQEATYFDDFKGKSNCYYHTDLNKPSQKVSGSGEVLDSVSISSGDDTNSPTGFSTDYPGIRELFETPGPDHRSSSQIEEECLPPSGLPGYSPRSGKKRKGLLEGVDGKREGECQKVKRREVNHLDETANLDKWVSPMAGVGMNKKTGVWWTYDAASHRLKLFSPRKYGKGDDGILRARNAAVVFRLKSLADAGVNPDAYIKKQIEKGRFTLERPDFRSWGEIVEERDL